MPENHSPSEPASSPLQGSDTKAGADNQSQPNNQAESPNASSVASLLANVLAKLEPWVEKLQKTVRPVLTQVRARLPASIAGKLSDPILTGILLGALAFLIVIGISWLSPSSPKVVAQGSDAQPISSADRTAETADLSLNPEQPLIVAIQDQVAEVTDAYADGLIQSVKANFRSSLLIVRAGEAWYELEGASQDQMANELWRRSKELDFNHLQLLDPDDALVARSPVVGPRMIILRREDG